MRSFFALVWLIPSILNATPRFVDATTDSGLGAYTGANGMGNGAVAADFDADGDIDIFLPTSAGTANQLYVNRGDGSFDEQAASIGLADPRPARSALWYDYDGDGDLDLAVARDRFDGSGPLPRVSLFQQDPGGFVDVTERAGLFDLTTGGDVHVGGLSAGDVNGDGLPDLFVAIWQRPAILYLSGDFSRPATDSDDSGGYGIASGIAEGGTSGHWQGLFHDFDEDGRTDLFINIDFFPNQLWMNQGANNFVDIAATAGTASAWNEMGLAGGDIDNDGDLDLYATNIFGWQDQPRQNNLWINQSTPTAVTFDERAASAGVDDTDWGWGATFFDADNDGDLDLAATNGYCQADYCGAEHQFDQSRLFTNQGDGSQFDDESIAAGFADTMIGSALMSADFDRDGRLDLLQTSVDEQGQHQLRLLRNTSSSDAAGYLTVVPTGIGGNTQAIGARIMIEAAGKRQYRWITAGNSFMSQEPTEAHFGVGSASVITQVIIDWPGGGQNIIRNVSVNGLLTVDQNDLFSDGFEQ